MHLARGGAACISCICTICFCATRMCQLYIVSDISDAHAVTLIRITVTKKLLHLKPPWGMQSFLFCSCCCIPSIRKLCTQYFDGNVNGCSQNLIGYGLVAVPRHTCANGHGNGRELYMQNTRKCVEVTQSAFRELNSLTNLAFNLCKRGQT